MNSLSLELSSKVKKSKYANFSRAFTGTDHIFMAGVEECAPDYIIERSDFPAWTLEVVVNGTGTFKEGRRNRILRHGSVFTYGPGIQQNFWNEPERPFRKYFFVRGGSTFPAAWQACGLRPGTVLQLGSVAPLIGILDRILDEGRRSDSQTGRVVDGLEQVLLAQIERHQGTAKGNKTISRTVYDTAMDILLREYQTLHSLSDLAKRSGYSSEYLCRLFKKYHGQSPYQVLLHRKMSGAWVLLRDGQLQVSAVAHELGYEDPLHFSRVFHKIMGCAPSAVKSGGGME